MYSIQHPYLFSVLILVLSFSSVEGNKQIEILGFESWEEPTPDQIQDQYLKLTKAHNQNAKRDEAANKKFDEIRLAFKELKARNFIIIDESQKNQPIRRSRNRQEQRTQKAHSYSYSRTYQPKYKRQYGSNFNLEDVLNLIDMDFVTLKDEAENQDVKVVKLELGLKDFLNWIISRPTILLAALLISIGIINLCTCCFCYLCKCWKPEKQVKKSKQNHQQSNENSSLSSNSESTSKGC